MIIEVYTLFEGSVDQLQTFGLFHKVKSAKLGLLETQKICVIYFLMLKNKLLSLILRNSSQIINIFYTVEFYSSKFSFGICLGWFF